MKNEAYTKYAEIAEQIKHLEEQQGSLKLECLDDMEAKKLDQVKLDGVGTFSITERKSWEYSPAVKEKDEELKSLKKTEEHDGTATSTVSKSLRFQAAK